MTTLQAISHLEQVDAMRYEYQELFFNVIAPAFIMAGGHEDDLPMLMHKEWQTYRAERSVKPCS